MLPLGFYFNNIKEIYISEEMSGNYTVQLWSREESMLREIVLSRELVVGASLTRIISFFI